MRRFASRTRRPACRRPPAPNGRLGNGLLAVIGILFALPMLWLLAASLDSQASWSIEFPHFTLANFRAATGSSQLHSLWNSVVLSAVATIVSTVASSLAAYALSRRRIPWKGPLLLIVLFLSGIPMSILIVPIYQLFATENWLSILPTAIFLGVTAMPFEIWLIKNFMDAIPYDLEEAARIERASTWHILTRIVGPLALPGIGAGAIYAFVNAWGSFVVPLVLITDPNQQPGRSPSTASSAPPTSATGTSRRTRCSTRSRCSSSTRSCRACSPAASPSAARSRDNRGPRA